MTLSKKIISLITAISFINLTSCASMFGSTANKSFLVNTNVDKTKVYIDGAYYGTTETNAMLIRLDGSSGHIITLKKEGYQPVTLPIDRTIQGAYLLNVPLLVLFVIPGVLALVIDGAAGNVFKYDPITVNLGASNEPKKS
jgi:hypothetical protein